MDNAPRQDDLAAALSPEPLTIESLMRRVTELEKQLAGTTAELDTADVRLLVLDDTEDDLTRANAALQQISNLHKPHATYRYRQCCTECGHQMPCATLVICGSAHQPPLAGPGTANDADPERAAYNATAASGFPMIDPDCRDGKHGSCVGAPCECGCHTRKAL